MAPGNGSMLLGTERLCAPYGLRALHPAKRGYVSVVAHWPHSTFHRWVEAVPVHAIGVARVHWMLLPASVDDNVVTCHSAEHPCGASALPRAGTARRFLAARHAGMAAHRSAHFRSRRSQAEGIFTARQAPLTRKLAQPRSSLIRFAWLSVAASIVIMGLKAYAYWVTGSVGLLSDALESVVNLVSACVALVVLTIAARPADEDHPYGHDKAEYFSSGFEGGMILIAALGIAGAAIDRLLHPQPLQQLGLGLSVSLIASVINFVVARILLTAGRRHDSITLEADAHHLMTDVWTSIGVLVGVGAVSLTGWTWLDPAVALGVAVNIVWTGWICCGVRRSVSWTRRCRPSNRMSSARCSTDTAPTAFSTTRCARVEQQRAVLSRCTCSCRVHGRCNADTICWSVSKEKCASGCPIRRSRYISSRWKIRGRGATR